MYKRLLNVCSADLQLKTRPLISLLQPAQGMDCGVTVTSSAVTCHVPLKSAAVAFVDEVLRHSSSFATASLDLYERLPSSSAHRPFIVET